MISEHTIRTVVLAGGDYPSHPLPLGILHDAEQIVCCDGAAFELIKHGGKPWRIVGDCDSILAPCNEQEQKILNDHKDIIRRFRGQEDNDLTKAIKYCIDHGLRSIAILGATGRREDHTLGNISLLIEYMKMGADVRMFTDHGVFIPCHNQISLDIDIPEDFNLQNDTIATRPKSIQISIFNFSAKELSAEGLRYPLYDFTQWWQGTLNEAVNRKIKIQGTGDFLVYITYA